MKKQPSLRLSANGSPSFEQVLAKRRHSRSVLVFHAASSGLEQKYALSEMFDIALLFSVHSCLSPSVLVFELRPWKLKTDASKQMKPHDSQPLDALASSSSRQFGIRYLFESTAVPLCFEG